jgi:hypothetical protein
MHRDHGQLMPLWSSSGSPTIDREVAMLVIVVAPEPI